MISNTNNNIDEYEESKIEIIDDFDILNDPLALSIAVKEQYELVANNN